MIAGGQRRRGFAAALDLGAIERVEADVRLGGEARIEHCYGALGACGTGLGKEHEQIDQLGTRDPARRQRRLARVQERQELGAVRDERSACGVEVRGERRARRSDIGRGQCGAQRIERRQRRVAQREAALQRGGGIQPDEEILRALGRQRGERVERPRQRPGIIALQPAAQPALCKKLASARIVSGTGERALARGDGEITLLWMKRIGVC